MNKVPTSKTTGRKIIATLNGPVRPRIPSLTTPARSRLTISKLQQSNGAACLNSAELSSGRGDSVQKPLVDLSESAVKEARKTGCIDLSSRNLSRIPDRVFSLNVETGSLSMSLDENPTELKWWEFKELKKLVVAHNCIAELPVKIQGLNNLQILNAQDNLIVQIPSEIGLLENLCTLILARNKIEALPIELYKLTNLTELKLGVNHLREILPEIGNLVNLQELDLQHNQLAALPPDIGFLSKLNILNLRENKLTELPPDFSGLTGLRQLDLTDNLLTDIGSLLSEFSHLEVLYLQSNKLKEIPVLDKARKLTELHMGCNQLTRFSSTSLSATKVQLVDLRENKIKELDIFVEDLELVDRFYLSNNNIQVIPNELSALPALKQVTLVGNPLKGIRADILDRGPGELIKYLRNRSAATVQPAEKEGALKIQNPSGARSYPDVDDLGIDPHKLKDTRQLTICARKIKDLPDPVALKIAAAKVTAIYLTDNLLSSFPQSFESACVQLKELSLDKNRFSSLPSWIGTGCPNLQYLTFQNNQVKDLPEEFANLKKLREINFSFNGFTAIPYCLYELPELEIVLAESNKIGKVDVEKLKQLPKLATLNLSNNNIDHCPPDLGSLPLTHLSIQGNLFRIPPHHILAKGTEATKSYLRNRIVPPKQ